MTHLDPCPPFPGHGPPNSNGANDVVSVCGLFFQGLLAPLPVGALAPCRSPRAPVAVLLSLHF